MARLKPCHPVSMAIVYVELLNNKASGSEVECSGLDKI